ncbi:MAG: gliding motility-associated protein GldE [Chitinophagales bacterium]|nr:gliding motility-associated protein GldE [Chitinophagales bacterium]
MTVTFPIELALSVLTIFMLLLMSVFVTGSEHALFSLTSGELEEMENKAPRTSRHIQHLIARPRRLLMLIRVLQTIVNVGILFFTFRIGVLPLDNLVVEWFGYFFELVLLIIVLLVFEEIIPKVFAGRNNILWSKIMAGPLFYLGQVLYPVTELLINASYFVEKKFARPDEGRQEEVMEKQEEQLMEDSDQHDLPILKGILKFGTITIRQIMKPRIDMNGVDEKLSFQQLLKTVRETRYSRLPVYRKTLDEIVGILYSKDLLNLLDNEKQNWQSLIRTAYFVPEGKKISELLTELQKNQTHISIVVDEYGRTAGLVTLEDIVEEIIGEIRDETDERIELEYVQVDKNNFVFEGKTSISDFCHVMNIPENFFDEVKSESDSLGGLLLEIQGNIPQPNEVIEYENFLFTVLSLENYRIQKVKVTRSEIYSAGTVNN